MLQYRRRELRRDALALLMQIARTLVPLLLN